VSATAEKRKTNPAKRVEIFQHQLDRRRAKLEAVTTEIEELEAGQHDVTETLRVDPTKSAFERGKPASERERKRVELERSAAHLRQEIAAPEAEAAAAGAELAERRLGEAVLRARKLLEEERDVVGRAGSLLASLIKPWNARVALLNDRRALAESVRVESLVQAVAASRPELVSAWEEAAASTLASEALSFAAFVNVLLEAALADRPDVEAEHAAVDELNARRRELARRNLGGSDDLPQIPKPVIRVDPLYELVPDLRADVKAFDPTIAGEPLALGRPDEGEIEGLHESGFGLTAALGYTNDGNLRVPWRRSPAPGGEAA
jgi:hypothetical protein